jgi:hypothetical protein
MNTICLSIACDLYLRIAYFNFLSEKKSRSLFFFLSFSYIVLSFLLDEAEFFLDIGAERAGKFHEGTRDAEVRSKLLIQLPSLNGKRAEVLKDERN